MNTINSLTTNTNTPMEITPRKPQDSAGKIVEPRDSFSASKTAVDNKTYGPENMKTEETSNPTFTERLKEAGKGAFEGIKMGLIAGATMTVIGGIAGVALFGAGDFLLDIMMVPHNMQVGMGDLVTLAKMALTIVPGFFGTIGALGGFFDLSSKENNEEKPAPPPQLNPSPAQT